MVLSGELLSKKFKVKLITRFLKYIFMPLIPFYVIYWVLDLHHVIKVWWEWNSLGLWQRVSIYVGGSWLVPKSFSSIRTTSTGIEAGLRNRWDLSRVKLSSPFRINQAHILYINRPRNLCKDPRLPGWSAMKRWDAENVVLMNLSVCPSISSGTWQWTEVWLP